MWAAIKRATWGDYNAEHADIHHEHDRDHAADRERAAAAAVDGAPPVAEPTPAVDFPGIGDVPKTGVIYVMARARKCGYVHGDPTWSNLGQGSPETNTLPGEEELKTQRPRTVELNDEINEYAPVVGVRELRERVATLYNARYRQGKASQYTFENVCICPGGRAAMTRLACAFNHTNVGFFLPEYTAYEQMLGLFRGFVSIPKPRSSRHRFQCSLEEMREEINGRGIGVLVMSNPCNPTGQLIEGDILKGYVQAARDCECTMVMDEFYSHYVYSHPAQLNGRTVSAAEFVDDVNADPIVIIDGLTKGWRLPGWRVCWIVAPKRIIAQVASAGSFLEGGANHPMQMAAMPLLAPAYANADAKLLQDHFREKRDMVITRLRTMGVIVEWEPLATFYIWINLENLPPPINTGLGLFEEALRYHIIMVPGIFFDVNPGRRRELSHSPYHHYIRLSFGPPMDELKVGMDNLERLVTDHCRTWREQHGTHLPSAAAQAHLHSHSHPQLPRGSSGTAPVSNPLLSSAPGQASGSPLSSSNTLEPALANSAPPISFD